MAKTILFDFDGTIADTATIGVATFNELAERYGFLAITPENAEMLRSKGPRQAMKTLEIPLYRAPLVLRALRKGVRQAMPSLHVVEGLRAAMVELRARGYRFGIVTSNTEENVRLFLKDHGMDFFDFIEAGTSIFRKAAAIKKMLVRHELQNDEVVFVGDEIRDVEAAKKNNIPVVGVTWGVNSREGLASAGPEYIIDSAEELMGLLG